MKKLAYWITLAIFLMIGCPWLTVTFAGVNGMAVCLLLFFVINPLFCVLCGIFAGKLFCNKSAFLCFVRHICRKAAQEDMAAPLYYRNTVWNRRKDIF